MPQSPRQADPAAGGECVSYARGSTSLFAPATHRKEVAVRYLLCARPKVGDCRMPTAQSLLASRQEHPRLVRGRRYALRMAEVDEHAGLSIVAQVGLLALVGEREDGHGLAARRGRGA